MAGRNHTRQVPHHQHQIDDHRLHRLNHHSAISAPVRSHLLEDRIAIQHRDIQSLLIDNQRLAATHVALKQELSLAQKDLRHLSAAAADIKAERDTEVRDVYERCLKLDAEVRAIDAINAELDQVSEDVQKLSVIKQELTAQLQAINGDLVKVKKDTELVPAIKAEIESFHKEIQRGRAAIEYEKKTHASNLEQRQIMEKNMIAMAREIEKLHAELANAEKRARASAAAAANPSPGYSANHSNTDMAYGGSPYADPYGMHQVQSGADAGTQYVSGAMPHAPYDIQRTHVLR